MPTPTAQVAYFEAYPDLTPGRQYFKCSRLHCQLTPEACVEQHRRALKENEGKLSSCRRCPIGTAHAGTDPTTLASYRAADTRFCIRCGISSQRLINSDFCPSCYNRAREARIGRNARGKAPVGFTPLSWRRVGFQLPEGKLHWRLIETQTGLESLMKGLRGVSEAKLSNSQPGESIWNVEGKRFEYQDDQGRPLMEFQATDTGHKMVHYRPALPGETPAPVTRGVSLYDPGFMVAWLEASNEDQYLGTAWQALAYGCNECRQGVMQARRRAGRLTVRCTGCGIENGG